VATVELNGYFKVSDFHSLLQTFFHTTLHIQTVIFNVCFYSHYYTLSHIMLVIIIILYPFAYNKQQTQNITPYIINAIVCYFNQNVHICMQYQSKCIVICTRTSHIPNRYLHSFFSIFFSIF
jgi:hypothetical protein